MDVGAVVAPRAVDQPGRANVGDLGRRAALAGGGVAGGRCPAHRLAEQDGVARAGAVRAHDGVQELLAGVGAGHADALELHHAGPESIVRLQDDRQRVAALGGELICAQKDEQLFTRWW